MTNIECSTPSKTKRGGRTIFSDDKVEEIKELYYAGLPLKEIGSILGYTDVALSNLVCRGRIPKRPAGFPINSIFTSTSLSREESYFLGLLITDGCITGNTVTLGLQERDGYMIERFAAFMGPLIKVYRYLNRNGGKYQCIAKTRSEELCQRLEQLGNFKNKSFQGYLKVPLDFDILRGIIDGNGCVQVSKRQHNTISIISASDLLLEQIKLFLKDYAIEVKIDKHPSKTAHTIRLTRRADIVWLYNNLYVDTDLFLTRKKEKYLYTNQKVNS